MLIIGKMAFVLAELGLLMGGLKLLERTGRVHPEVLRKLLHVAMGVTVLSFPWLFTQRWPVLVMAGLATMGLLVMHLVPALRLSVGTVVSGVKRASLGDVYFPITVGVLWVLSRGDVLLFSVPVLVLTLADATAALVGVRYGSVHYSTHDGRKSAEGSFAFFLVAFLSVHVPVLLATDTGRIESLMLGVIVGLLVMLLESVSWRGVDNLLVPLGTYTFLVLYLDTPAEALAWRAAAVVVLAGFTLLWRWRSSMNDSALIGCALFGYAAILLGGPAWLLPPLALFLTHGILWPGRDSPPMHSVGAVISVTCVGMACLLLEVTSPWAGWLWVYTAGFAAHLAIVCVSYMLHDRALKPPRRIYKLLTAGSIGWILVYLPVALTYLGRSTPDDLILIGAPMAVTTYLAAAAFESVRPWLYGNTGSPIRVHGSGIVIATTAAAVNALSLMSLVY